MIKVSPPGVRPVALALTLIVVLGAAVCSAQIVDSGRISGTVQDSSGGVIANADVVFRNDATGLTDRTATNGDGLFVSQPLAPAEYSVAVEQPGFAKVIQHVHLEVGQRASITLILSPGKASETVNVEANAAFLGTETSTLSNLRTEHAVENLPLDGRNFAELVDLSAGVSPAQSQVSTVALSAVRGETSYSVNGLRPEENNYLLDGISDTENHNGLGIVLFPPLDAVEEFREETSGADARYGRGGGGTINLVFKSGTDQFHGDLFEFLRNSDLDAKNFFDKRKPPFKMNQFGVTFGGPLLGRRNPKTFFFVDYQGTRTDQGLTYISTVPTALERTGNFSALPQQIYNPLTTVQAANGTYSRTPFAGNIIPSGQISQVGQNLINLYPLPNLPGFANNYLYQPTRTLVEDEYDGRVDHRFSDKDSSFLRYSHARDNIYQPGPLPAPAVGGAISGLSREPSDQAVLSENHVFSSTAINTARVGWSRVGINSTDANAGQALATQVGIPGSNVPGNPLTDGLPMIPVTGAATLGSYGNLPATIVSNNYQVDDSVSLIRGRHTFTFGGELQRRQYNIFQTANLRGTMSFTTAY
ncbi:MAG: TonB-dependent receptor, partial [Bryobacteraceae bacterium]